MTNNFCENCNLLASANAQYEKVVEQNKNLQQELKHKEQELEHREHKYEQLEHNFKSINKCCDNYADMIKHSITEKTELLNKYSLSVGRVQQYMQALNEIKNVIKEPVLLSPQTDGLNALKHNGYVIMCLDKKLTQISKIVNQEKGDVR